MTFIKRDKGVNMPCPKISVIVPMYNVERYLEGCVKSILDQTMEDIEIILVDDGSPDRSGDIAEMLAAGNPIISVVHRQNGGLGPARNSGLAVARGEYVGFVDPDDWIESDLYKRLYDAAKRYQAQIIYSGYKIFSHGELKSELVHPYASSVFKGADEICKIRRSFYGALPKKVRKEYVPVSACFGIYKRSFLNDNSLTFQNIRSEDVLFNISACRVANTVVCTDGTGYCYRKDDQPSLTNGFDSATISSFGIFYQALLSSAMNEVPALRDECLLRAHRCILDMSRSLIKMIEHSMCSSRQKRDYILRLYEMREVKSSCNEYPFWRLPFQQIAFFLCVKHKYVALARVLVRLKDGAF